MTNRTIWLFSCVFSVFITFASGQFDKYCGTKMVSCDCGKEGYMVSAQIKQCVRWYRWEPRCDDCKGQPSIEQTCSVYRNCLDCEEGLKQCVRCPPDRYGKWCTGVCPSCANDGICDRNTGKCICANGFKGNECQLRTGCPPPSLIDGGIFDFKESYPLGSSIMYRCKEGRVLQGSSIISCLDNGQWHPNFPICKIVCPSVANPSNGVVKHDVESQTLTYFCLSGYKLIGNSNRKCSLNSTWIGAQPKCVKIITCAFWSKFDKDLIIINGSQKENFTKGHQLDFTCQNGFALLGKEWSKCKEDGTWSSVPPKCVPLNLTCSHPGDLKNGKTTVTGDKGNNVYLQGTSITFECPSLHQLKGHSKITCGVNNTWSANVPECIKVITCPDLPKLRNGNIAITKPDNPKGTALRRRKLILLPIPIPKRATAATSKIRLPPGHNHVGTFANITCNDHYEIKGAASRSCLATGEWSGTTSSCEFRCGQVNVPRTPLITSGAISKIGQWPWQVGIAQKLGDDWFLYCGGSLISESWVVTAAHCIIDDETNLPFETHKLKLYFGKFYRNNSMDDNFVQNRPVVEIHVHDHYEPFTLDADIALLRVSFDVQFTTRVQPVCLPDKRNERRPISEGRIGTVIGWGLTEDDATSDVLRHTQVPVVPLYKCREHYESVGSTLHISDNMLCAGFESGDTNSCDGDSGGPLVFPENDRWVLEGVVSWNSNNGCNEYRQYAGYTRIRQFIDWIDEFVNK